MFLVSPLDGFLRIIIGYGSGYYVFDEYRLDQEHGFRFLVGGVESKPHLIFICDVKGKVSSNELRMETLALSIDTPY